MRSLRTLTTVGVAAAALGFAPVPASADHNTCGTGHLLQYVVASTGTVDTFDGSDFWKDQSVAGPETLRLIALKPVTGDSDLYVWSADCSTLICASINGGDAADTCLANASGDTNIEVAYYSDGSSQYTLSVTYSPLFIN